jgi:uncharacterized SAM-binding protein YcdF (DUF218 family)
MDTIIVLSGGVIKKDGELRSATYQEEDSFGTLGGYARVQAASALAKEYPHALIVTTSKPRFEGELSGAAVLEKELRALGVKNHIVLEERSSNTREQIDNALRLAQGTTSIVTNEYHIPRVKAFLGERKATVLSAEKILNDPSFETLRNTEPYKRRLASEAKGLKAYMEGTYSAADQKAKLEK